MARSSEAPSSEAVTTATPTSFGLRRKTEARSRPSAATDSVRPSSSPRTSVPAVVRNSTVRSASFAGAPATSA